MKSTKEKFLTLSGMLIAVVLLFSIFTIDSKAASTMPEASNGVVKLTEDVTLTAGYVVPAGTTLKIDLNGHTIKTTTGLKADVITVEKGATLTITGNGTITNSYTADDYAAVYNNGNTTIDGATLELDTTVNGNTFYVVLNHGIMKTKNTNMSSNDFGSSLIENGYYNYSSTDPRRGHIDGVNEATPKLAIYSGIYDGGLNTIKNDDNGEIVIENGTFRNTKQVSLMNWNVATVNGGTFLTPTGDDKTNIFIGNYGKDSVDKGILTINGGTFEAEHLLEGYTGVVTPIKINGGTFKYTKSLLNESVDKIHASLKEADGIDVVGKVTAPSTVLKYAKTGAEVTITDTVSVGDNFTVPEGVKVVLPSSDSKKELVKDENGNYVVKYKEADYSKVNEAVKNANKLNKADYKDFSKVEDALKNVEYKKNITEQDEVDKYAKAINDAIDGLEKVEKKEELKDGEKIKNPATGDFVLVYVGLIVIATVIAVFAKKQVKAKHNK